MHRCNSVFFLFSYLQERIRLIRSNGKAVNSNLEKLVIISQSIELENNVSSFTLIKSGFSKPPKTMYVLLDALEPNKSGAYVKLYLNNQGDLYTTTESMLSGTWYINGAYISV